MERILSPGEKVHVVTLRRFEQDLRRHFVGTVAAVEGPVARIEGFAFVYNASTSEYERRPEKRVRILPLDDSGLLINILPSDVDIEAIHYALVGQHMVATDGAFTLDINEFGMRA